MLTVTDISTSFGFPTFLRVFFPGVLGSVLYGSLIYLCLIVPNVELQSYLNAASLAMCWIVFIVLFGLTVVSLDFYIYQFFEGFRFWPMCVWRFVYRQILSDFKRYSDYKTKIEEDIRTAWIEIEDYNSKLSHAGNCQTEAKEYEDLEVRNIVDYFRYRNDESNLLYRLCEYPYQYKFSGRYPRQPTRLGNIMAEYETYSYVKYGISMMVFWSHLWLIIPEEVRNYLDFKGAIADVLVYVSFIFLTYAPIAGVVLTILYQGNLYDYWSSVFCNWVYNFGGFVLEIVLAYIPMTSCNLLCSYWILAFKLCIGLMLFVLVVTISLTLSYLFYLMSLQALVSYGRSVKAIFDIYRLDLAEKFGIQASHVPDDNEFKSWEKCGMQLLDH